MNILSLIILLQTTIIWANGSSGVGSVKVPVVDEIEMQMDESLFVSSNRAIVRKQENKEVLLLEPLSPEEFSRLVKKYTSSILGTVKAWEYLPDREKEKNILNSWIVCSAANNCTKIIATEASGRDAATLVGSLVRSEKY